MNTSIPGYCTFFSVKQPSIYNRISKLQERSPFPQRKRQLFLSVIFIFPFLNPDPYPSGSTLFRVKIRMQKNPYLSCAAADVYLVLWTGDVPGLRSGGAHRGRCHRRRATTEKYKVPGTKLTIFDKMQRVGINYQ